VAEGTLLPSQCRDLFLHPGRFRGPRTIYPPTPKQYDAFINFLLGAQPPIDGSNCPIPIYATLENRWRYHPWDSMTRFNIFRDRHERKPPSGPKPRRCVVDGVDWPEIIDEHRIMLLHYEALGGRPLDQAAVDRALEGLKQITPSSPCWGRSSST
jgi:hypothetical protein